MLVTVLLVVAALGTSWSSYQATRWNGEQAKAASRTNAIRIERRAGPRPVAGPDPGRRRHVHRLGGRGPPGRGELAAFYVDRFRAEFQPAFDAWLATRAVRRTRPRRRRPSPCRSTSSPPEGGRTARRGRRGVGGRGAPGHPAIASNYVLTVVLYAVVLFFAGMSTKLARPAAALGDGRGRLPRPGRRPRVDRHLPGELRTSEQGRTVVRCG